MDENRRRKSLKFVDWFEAAGREASCEVPAGLLDESIIDRSGDESLESEEENSIKTKQARIAVCKDVSGVNSNQKFNRRPKIVSPTSSGVFVCTAPMGLSAAKPFFAVLQTDKQCMSCLVQVAQLNQSYPRFSF